MLAAAEPQLFTTDFARSVAFYQRIGFALVFAYGDPPFYGQVARDGARLNLRHVDRPVIDDTVRQAEDLVAATLPVDRAEAIESLFREFHAAAIPVHQKLRIEPWGSRTFIIRDPDGNLLLFAGPA